MAKSPGSHQRICLLKPFSYRIIKVPFCFRKMPPLYVVAFFYLAYPPFTCCFSNLNSGLLPATGLPGNYQVLYIFGIYSVHIGYNNSFRPYISLFFNNLSQIFLQPGSLHSGLTPKKLLPFAPSFLYFNGPWHRMVLLFL
jgi:hypothetical protein